MVSTCIIYPGGKTLLLPVIRKLVPPHKLCLDLFGGGGAFILDDIHEIGVYNDKNSNAVNFFRVLRDEELANSLIERLRHTPYSREEYFLCDAAWGDTDDPVERARQWFVLINLGFTHEEDCHSFRVAAGTNVAKSVRNHVDDLPLVVDKLRNITIENLDFRKAMQIYGHGKDTLIFADPPYITPMDRQSLRYKNVMNPRDHYELLMLLKRTDANVILCGYESEMYMDMLRPPDWRLKIHERVAQVGNSDYDEREVRREHIWVKGNNTHGLFDQM